MVANPRQHFYRLIFQLQQLVNGFLSNAVFNVAGNSFPFPVLFHQVLPFPTALQIFQLLIFHRELFSDRVTLLSITALRRISPAITPSFRLFFAQSSLDVKLPDINCNSASIKLPLFLYNRPFPF
ncbi:hypothetical protein D3C78_1601140 [compost metagenome]